MSSETPHIVLVGGGTAGHVNPLLAVADAIRDLDADARISVIGTSVGLERQLVPQAGYELDAIDKVPFPRRLNAAALRFPRDWYRETRRVRAILERRQAQVVVGFGGYASAPVYSMAHRMGLPIAIHEQNARAGMANKLGSRWASFIGTAYEDTGLRPGHRGVIRRVGLPLRPAIAQLCAQLGQNRQEVRRRSAEQLGVNPDRPLIVVTGGSLGAASVNRAVASAAKDLLERAQIVHLTGRGKMNEVRTLVSDTLGSAVLSGVGADCAAGGDYHVAEYLERIDLAFGCADLVICRSGAGSVSELAAIGMPAVYVPLPIGNGEQRFNAQPVVQAGGGLMVADHDFDAAWVSAHIPVLLGDSSRLQQMGEAAWQYGIRDAAAVMTQEVLRLAGHRRTA